MFKLSLETCTFSKVAEKMMVEGIFFPGQIAS